MLVDIKVTVTMEYQVKNGCNYVCAEMRFESTNYVVLLRAKYCEKQMSFHSQKVSSPTIHEELCSH